MPNFYPADRSSNRRISRRRPGSSGLVFSESISQKVIVSGKFNVVSQHTNDRVAQTEENKPPVDPAALLDLETSTAANLYVWLNSSTPRTAPYKAKLNATQGKSIVSQTPIHQTELLPAVSHFITTDTGPSKVPVFHG